MRKLRFQIGLAGQRTTQTRWIRTGKRPTPRSLTILEASGNYFGTSPLATFYIGNGGEKSADSFHKRFSSPAAW
jgi:hypothetical protein